MNSYDQLWLVICEGCHVYSHDSLMLNHCGAVPNLGSYIKSHLYEPPNFSTACIRRWKKLTFARWEAWRLNLFCRVFLCQHWYLPQQTRFFLGGGLPWLPRRCWQLGKSAWISPNPEAAPDFWVLPNFKNQQFIVTSSNITIIWPYRRVLHFAFYIPSLKLTFSPLKMDGWNTILSYCGPAYFQGLQ